MSNNDDENEPKSYKEGNTLPDGSYAVGKNKPPFDTRFRENDGRKRGRRKKGTRNLRTDFLEELNGKISLIQNGKIRKVSRQRAIVMRLMDNAGQGQNSAISKVLTYCERFEVTIAEENGKTDDQAKSLPGLKEMTDEEIAAFGPLLEKALGIEPEPPPPPGPLDYMGDRTDERNYFTERSVEGVTIRSSRFEDIEDEIIEIESNAYLSAILPAKSGCFRRTL